MASPRSFRCSDPRISLPREALSAGDRLLARISYSSLISLASPKGNEGTSGEEQMKYLFLAYGEERQLAAMPASERDALGSECMASDELLRKRGHLLAVQGLQNSRTATTVRVKNGKVVVTD